MSDDKRIASQMTGADPTPAPINSRFDGERLPPDEQLGYVEPVTRGTHVGRSDRERVPEDER